MILKEVKEVKLPLVLDLQFFAEGEGSGSEGEGQQQASSGITPRGNTFNFTEPTEVPEYQGGIEPLPWEHQPRGSMVDENHDMGNSQPNPLSKQLEEQTNQTQNEGEQKPTSLEFDFGGRKVRTDDPDSIKGAYEDWQNAQRTIQQLQQQTNQYEQFLQNLNQMGVLPNQNGQQQAQPNQQTTQQPQQVPLPSKERMAELHDEYMNKMYENKFEADLWWEQQPEVQAWRKSQTEQFVNPLIQPIQQERQTNQRINEMKQKYQDFDEYVPKMQELLDQRPELNSVEQIENVYWIAKAQALESQPTLEQRLEDPEFRQRLVQDERFRNEVLSNYQSQKQNQRMQAPPMVGNRGGQTPTFAYKPPKSIREAGRLVRQNIRFN